VNRQSHDVLDEALRLSPKQRAELLASLNGEVDNDVEAAWAVEIEHRARRVLNGEAEFEDWASIRDELRRNS